MCSSAEESGLKESRPPVNDQCVASIAEPRDGPDTAGEEVQKTTSMTTSGAVADDSNAEEVLFLVKESLEAAG